MVGYFRRLICLCACLLALAACGAGSPTIQDDPAPTTGAPAESTPYPAPEGYPGPGSYPAPSGTATP